MNDTLTITDNGTKEKVTVSFAQYYDLIISLKCASELYGEMGDKSKVKDFKKMTKILQTLI
tara:strand:- start:184 stop:366 length:183 start_codon:yes stop_codon:yes gene_type:complete